MVNTHTGDYVGQTTFGFLLFVGVKLYLHDLFQQSVSLNPNVNPHLYHWLILQCAFNFRVCG